MLRVPPVLFQPLSQFGQLINQLFIEVLGPGDRQVSYLWTLISECPQFSGDRTAKELVTVGNI